MHNCGMRNVRRYYEGGGYFFTVTAYRRRPFFKCDRFVQALRDAIRATQATHPFTIEAWVIMPDHMHCVWLVPDDKIALRWRKIKSLTTKALPEFANQSTAQKNSTARRRRGNGSLWQHSYYEHTIRNEKEFELYILYCCYNPVKHGYVENALDWPYSSLRHFLATGKYPAHWAEINITWLNDTFGNHEY
ncbi:REP-associated tyrosine transposase [Pseudidiomarina sp. YC-516-91]|uniref:REP-associated tyrosine transposase n=1 Tax=Pseudidiomarina salilacus TaxID=3384452 RepID=UPI003984F157